MAHNKELGRRGEELSRRVISRPGACRSSTRNRRCRLGEIDLVARDGAETVFVEVKTRIGHEHGHPFEAITPTKLARMRRLAIAWCEASDAPVGRIRIDAVAVTTPDEAPAIIEHLEGVG